MRRISLLGILLALAACGDNPVRSAPDASTALDASTTVDAADEFDASQTLDASQAVDASVLADAAVDSSQDDLGTDSGMTPGTCTLGDTYGDSFLRPWVHLIRQTVLTPGDRISETREAQIIAALHESSHTDVTTLTEAFDRVDSHEIRYARYYDESNARLFESLEYGAGDNSYGAVFADGTTTKVMAIRDGDFYGCEIPRGPIGVPCTGSATCEGELECARGVGRYLDTTPVLGEGNACEGNEDCAVDFGLLCSTYSTCVASWTRGRVIVDTAESFPASGETKEHTFEVSGLTTVTTEAWIGLVTTLDDFSDVSITVEDPDGTVGTFVRGDVSYEGRMRLFPIRGIPGDERVNGTWKVRITTGASIADTIEKIELRLGSRWD
jgi:hypothetical protein